MFECVYEEKKKFLKIINFMECMKASSLYSFFSLSQNGTHVNNK